MLRLIHEHVVAGEEVEQVAVRREKNLRELALLALGPGNRVGDGVPLQVVAQQRWLSDDESIRLLRVCLDEQDGEALLGVDVQSPNTNLRIARRERELAEGLFAGDVDRLDRLELRIEHIEVLAVIGEQHPDRDANRDGNRVAHAEAGLVDNEDLLTIRTDVDGARAARHFGMRGRGAGPRCRAKRDNGDAL